MNGAVRIITACLLAGVACGSPGIAEPGAPAAAEGRWVRIPDGPLSARRSAIAFGVNGILYVFGGTEADPCPPTADCVAPKEAPRRDAASFDPATNEWHMVADAPVSLGYGSGVVVDDRIYLLIHEYGSSAARRAFLAYSTTQNTWTELPLPPDAEWYHLVRFGDDVIAYQSSQENGITGDHVFDVASEEWSELGVDPLAPTFDRSMVWTGDEIVLLGLPNVPNPGVKPSLYEVAKLSPAHDWQHLPDSEVNFNTPYWHFAGGKVVNSSILTIDGGETNNYGRAYPTGGIFDPETEGWSELPNPPEHDYQAFEKHITGIYVGGETWVTAGDGWAFHVPTGRWSPLPRPDGAPQYEMAATWVDDRLAIWGGVSWDGSQGRLHDDGWLWEPPS